MKKSLHKGYRLLALCLFFSFSFFSLDAQIACNRTIQVSLDENCSAEVTADMVLEGTYADYSEYRVNLTNAAGARLTNPLGSGAIGTAVTAKVTHNPTGNSCWGTINVEDKLGPKFNCSSVLRDKMGNTLQSGTVFNITCDVDVDDITIPRSVDNCDGNVREFLVSETRTGDECDVLTITRVYGGEDSHGNQGDECTITINITQPGMATFPSDITWTCDQYAAYPNIVDPAALNILIDPITACELDPNWDDNVDNPLNSNTNRCGQTSTETDTDPCLANFAGTYQDCVLDPNAHVPTVIQTPLHDRTLVRGLEDADVLEMTGAGVPSVFDQVACKFSVTWKDQKLEACDGVDTLIAFKIVRTWTVLNWCTGFVNSQVQVIKVLDKDAPTIEFADNFQTEYRADQYAASGAHADCGSSAVLALPTLSDNCSGVDMTSARLYTPAGEGVAQYDGAGNLIGFRIPAPYLGLGRHTVTYEVSDNCGNKATETLRITVIDGIPPVPVCREFTQVALSAATDGTVEVSAESFDEASYDNCSPVYFLVRKMDRADNCAGFNSEHSTFTPSIHFCCDNIGDTVNVILKVYDRDPGTRQSLTGLANNSNECMIRVLTEDKTRPECHAPADVWINCDEVADNLDLSDVTALAAKFGSATSTDNCGSSIEELTPDVDMDLCGVGTVVRNWRATDNYGNRNVGRCQQTIMIMAQNSYKINIPGDFEEECDDASPADLTYEEYGCDLLAVNLEEQDFPASPLGECKKVIRTWRVINWCEYDGASQPIRLPRLDLNGDNIVGDGMMGSSNTVTGNNLRSMHMYTSNGNTMVLNDGPNSVASTGYYEYIQHVKIFDNTAPDVSYDGDTQFCGGDRDEDPCTGVVNLPINTDDLCTSTTTTWELSAFSDSFAGADFQGNGTLSGRYPLGTHTVRYYVEDECRNISQLDITFEIIDCKAPTPVCYNGLSASLMPTGMVSIWASDFDASSFDYCHPFNLTVNVVTDQNGDGFIDASDYQTTSPSGTEVMLDCNHVGSITYIQLWVNEESDDNVNNSDYCVTFVEVQDNLDVCAGSRVALGGNIKNESGESVENVTVELNNGLTATTANDGEFAFSVPVDGDYTITPMKTDDVTNGVSTFDLLQISRHILNVEKLNSPYKQIAADANASGSISTLDLLAIRKVILRVESEFPTNTSWRFVEKDYIFQDAANALKENFKEVVSLNNLTSADLTANFVAIKVGDVNGDATPNSILGVDGRTFNGTLNFNATDKAVKAGEEFTVAFTADQNVEGFQFTTTFASSVELISIENGLTTDENFNVIDNQIVTSWNATTATKGAEVFGLTFVAKEDLNVSEVLTIGSTVVAAEAYANGNLLNVGLDFGTGAAASTFELMQNTPNPFKTSTVIEFNLPEATNATMTVSDVSGKVLRVIEGDYAAGMNQVTLEMTNDLPEGVLIYELKTATHKATRKMTAIK